MNMRQPTRLNTLCQPDTARNASATRATRRPQMARAKT